MLTKINQVNGKIRSQRAETRDGLRGMIKTLSLASPSMVRKLTAARFASSRALPVLLVTTVLAGCGPNFAFEEFQNSFVDQTPKQSAYTSANVKNEIKLFSEGLEEHQPGRLNSEFVSKGLLALANKDYYNANINFQRALKFEPQNAMLHTLNAFSHQLRAEAGDPQQFKMAEVGFDLAARMDPGDSKIHYHMGLLQFEQKQYRMAQEHFANAVNLDAENPDYLVGLAASSYYLGELDRAYTNIERAIKFAPTNSAALRSSGLIYASLGNFEKASKSSETLGDANRSGKKYLDRRILEWRSYYSNDKIKNDPVISKQLAQNLDAFGVPSAEDILNPSKSGLGVTTEPLAPAAEVEPVETLPPTTSSANSANPAITPTSDSSAAANSNTQDAASSAPAPAQAAVPAIVLPKMALVDVAIIRTEEIFKSSKGVNLLNGLNIFFTGDQLFQARTPLGVGQVRTPLATNDTLTLKLGTLGAGLTYSLNIFNSNFDRNEVIARPTILVEDQKKSSFFSGSTLHIVLEGGTAGSGSMEPIDTGVKLEVTPAFLDGNTVDLNVYVERTFLEAGLSQVSDTITGTSFASTSKTSISANLALRYGETMVLSGLSDQEKESLDDKTPGLGDLPGIQYLFRNQVKTTSKKTVLILLTPRRATLSYETGEAKTSADETRNSTVQKLEASTSWMRPGSNLSGFVQHLGQYEYFNHYRSGDMQLENWASDEKVNDAIMNALDFLYISNEFDKSEKSIL